MLSKNQKAQLEKCGRWAEEDSSVILHVCIGKYIQYRREVGKGYPITVKMFYTDEPQGYDLYKVISRCQSRYAAIDKAKEIARFLVSECGVGRAKVSIKSHIPF